MKNIGYKLVATDGNTPYESLNNYVLDSTFNMVYELGKNCKPKYGRLAIFLALHQALAESWNWGAHVRILKVRYFGKPKIFRRCVCAHVLTIEFSRLFFANKMDFPTWLCPPGTVWVSSVTPLEVVE